MWEKGLLIAVVLLGHLSVHAQQHKRFIIENNSDCRKVKLQLHTTYGQCAIHSTSGESYIEFQNPSAMQNGIDPEITDETTGDIKNISISHLNDGSDQLSTTISKQFFSGHMEKDCMWDIHLSDAKPMQLSLKYTVGDMDLNLSGLPIEKLSVNTGSANVKVFYEEGRGNKTEMDTLYIKADMGTLVTENLSLAGSENIIADIGFGKVLLDLAKPPATPTNVQATVGAGKLVVVLPAGNHPVRINVNDSPLCHISLPGEFVAQGNNEFVYGDSNGPELNFNIDVAIGSISFVFAGQ